MRLFQQFPWIEITHVADLPICWLSLDPCVFNPSRNHRHPQLQRTNFVQLATPRLQDDEKALRKTWYLDDSSDRRRLRIESTRFAVLLAAIEQLLRFFFNTIINQLLKDQKFIWKLNIILYFMKSFDINTRSIIRTIFIEIYR